MKCYQQADEHILLDVMSPRIDSTFCRTPEGNRASVPEFPYINAVLCRDKLTPASKQKAPKILRSNLSDNRTRD